MNKPAHLVTWRMLFISTTLLVLVMSTVSAVLGLWVWQHVGARLSLREQSAQIVLPPRLAASVRVNNALQVRLDRDLTVTVPFKQRLEIPLNDPLNLNVSVSTSVPINMNVPVKDVLHVDQIIDVDSTVTVKVAGVPVTLPVQGRIPLKADIPFNLTIPVKQEIPVTLNAPAKVRLAETIKADVNTSVTATIPLRESLQLPVVAPVDAILNLPQTPVEAGLTFVDLHVPFNNVSLEQNSAPKVSP